MGSKGSGTSTEDIQQQQVNNATALTQLAQQQGANSSALFGSTFPGAQSAEQFYQSLSTGDPYAIARAIAPAAQQISASTAGARTNIMNNTPAGGERNLALDQADLNQGAQVGSTASNGYLNSFNALAGLAGQGINQSIGAAGAGTSAFGASNSGLGQAGQLGIEQKGAQLGTIGSLAGSLSSGLATAF